MSDPRVVIIGGGPAGLTAAYDLSKAGIEAIVFERDQIVGGLSRTVEYKGYHFVDIYTRRGYFYISWRPDWDHRQKISSPDDFADEIKDQLCIRFAEMVGLPPGLDEPTAEEEEWQDGQSEIRGASKQFEIKTLSRWPTSAAT